MRLEVASHSDLIKKQLPAHQRTLAVGVKTKAPFACSLVKAAGGLQRCRMSVRSVVLDPRSIVALCQKHSLPADEEGSFLYESDLVAESSEEVLELITACHSDWVDAFLVDDSADFWVYADHDEYTTLYSQSASRLDDIVSQMVADGHNEVAGWKREPFI